MNCQRISKVVVSKVLIALPAHAKQVTKLTVLYDSMANANVNENTKDAPTY